LTGTNYYSVTNNGIFVSFTVPNTQTSDELIFGLTDAYARNLYIGIVNGNLITQYDSTQFSSTAYVMSAYVFSIYVYETTAVFYKDGVVISTGTFPSGNTWTLRIRMNTTSYTSYTLTDIFGVITGKVGAKGDTGAQGDTGQPGSVSATGSTGDTGYPGDTGYTGDTGPPGSVSATGATGATGDQGEQGATGDTGPPGSVSATGATGATGDQGEQGATGDTGPPGSVSATGATGDTGPAASDTNAWATYTPSWTTGADPQPSIGDGTITGRYKAIGKTVFVSVKINMGATTTYGSGAWRISLPVNAYASYSASLGTLFYDTAGGGVWYQGTSSTEFGGNTSYTIPLWDKGTTSSAAIDSAIPFSWAQSDFLTINGSYESI
jgi:hypothetical protein